VTLPNGTQALVILTAQAFGALGIPPVSWQSRWTATLLPLMTWIRFEYSAATQSARVRRR
jgi:hypothetical protein